MTSLNYEDFYNPKEIKIKIPASWTEKDVSRYFQFDIVGKTQQGMYEIYQRQEHLKKIHGKDDKNKKNLIERDGLEQPQQKTFDEVFYADAYRSK